MDSSTYTTQKCKPSADISIHSSLPYNKSLTQYVITHLINHITYIMNQELATLRANDYISNIAIIKSQKVLGSQTNFHLKT